MRRRVLRIGSRGSALATVQARLVRDALRREGQPARIVEIETEGDRRAPDTVWGEGAFVAAIERALLDGRVDIAVHSAKDIPTDEHPALRLAAYLPRADARDALVVRAGDEIRTIDDLPPGSRVGTDSPRRSGFLRARRPDLDVHPLNGNVDTRLRRLDAGETDALILACAGIDRLGLSGRIAQRLPPEVSPPAPGQGAISVQIRAADTGLDELIGRIDDLPTRSAVEAERAFLRASGGGCRAPIGAFATVDGASLEILGAGVGIDGSGATFGRQRGPVERAADLGRALAVELGLAAHAADAPRILITRPATQAFDLVMGLRAAGLAPVVVPAIEIELDGPGCGIDRAVSELHTVDWVAITSTNGARAVLAAAERVAGDLAAPRWAAIGDATRHALEDEGIEVDFSPSRSTAEALGAELPISPGACVLVVRGDLAGDRLATALTRRGAEVDDVVAYRTVEAPPSSRELLQTALADGLPALTILTSGSTVRGLAALGERTDLDVRAIPAVCLGPNTAATATEEGFTVVAVAEDPSPNAIVAATIAALDRQPVEVS